MKCECPIYCKYCGAKLKRDPIGHYCPTRNCHWQFGTKNCLVGCYDEAVCKKKRKRLRAMVQR